MSALSHRSHQAVLGALIAALVMVVLPAAAGAQSGVHGVPGAPVNAPGTDVAAPDQQSPRVVVNAPGTDVAAPDQQAPLVDRTAPVGPTPKAGDSGSTITLMALIALALGFAGVGFASWLAVSRKRSRATA
jgi:hypothetical protein